MTTYVDEGIILRRVDFSEADRILTILTPGSGKIGAIARGVRRPKSRLAAQTDLFSRSRMQLARGRGDLDILTQAQRVGSGREFGDARRAAYAAVCAELADRVLESRHPDEGMFTLVAGAIAACGDGLRDPRTAVAWFARRVVDRLGYAPQLGVCVACTTGLAEVAAPFSAVAGGLLCPGCAPADPGAVECSVRAIKVLRVIASGDAATYARLRLDPQTLDTLEIVVERELAQHLERRLRSLAVARALSRGGRIS